MLLPPAAAGRLDHLPSPHPAPASQCDRRDSRPGRAAAPPSRATGTPSPINQPTWTGTARYRQRRTSGKQWRTKNN